MILLDHSFNSAAFPFSFGSMDMLVSFEVAAFDVDRMVVSVSKVRDLSRRYKAIVMIGERDDVPQFLVLGAYHGFMRCNKQYNTECYFPEGDLVFNGFDFSLYSLDVDGDGCSCVAVYFRLDERHVKPIGVKRELKLFKYLGLDRQRGGR
ncbi:MAG: hypothetical protein KatS3mg087_0479 [Patescibacteria group bacterium]|nr:MAG: hypothetical protein KatS3mg087_0479 [Patescibacteria group bacterium]